MTTKSINTTDSNLSTYSASSADIHSNPLSNKVRTVFTTTSHSTALPSLPPSPLASTVNLHATITQSTTSGQLTYSPPKFLPLASPPSSSSTHTSTASALLSHSLNPVGSSRPRSSSAILPKKIETAFPFDKPLNLNLPDSPPLPPPPRSDERGGHRKISDPLTHTKVQTVFSSSKSSTQTTPLETLIRDVHYLSVPVSTRGRSHSASPRSRRKENNPNRLLYTESAASSSSSVSALSSDLLKPTRMSRQRSNSLPPPPESNSSGASKTTPVGTHYTYSRNGSNPNWCFMQMLYAETLVNQNEPAKAIEVYKKVIAEDRKSTVPWSEPYIRVAGLQTSNPDEAQQTLKLVIKGKNFDQWGIINALVMNMIVLEPSLEYPKIVEAYSSWRQAKELIRAQPDSMTVRAYLGHYGKIASKIRKRKEAIEGATTTV